MERQPKLLRDAIRQTLAVFPVGLLAAAVVFDLLAISDGNPGWSSTTFYMMGAGVTGGLISGFMSLVDWLTDTGGSHVWREAGSLGAVALFAWSWYLRSEEPAAPTNTALILSFAGAAVLLTVYWLGADEPELETGDLSENAPAS